MAFRAKSQSARIRKSDRASDEADEIPPYSSSSSMNVGNDIAQLSYKELQALALRYRVPGNIKVSCHRRRRDEDVSTTVSFTPSVLNPPHRFLSRRVKFIRTPVEDRAPIDRRLRSNGPRRIPRVEGVDRGTVKIGGRPDLSPDRRYGPDGRTI